MEFGSVSVCVERKTREPGEKPSEQRWEPTKNSTHMWRQRRELNPDHFGEGWVLSPLNKFESATFNTVVLNIPFLCA